MRVSLKYLAGCFVLKRGEFGSLCFISRFEAILEFFSKNDLIVPCFSGVIQGLPP